MCSHDLFGLKNSIGWRGVNTWTSEVDTVPLPGDELSFALGKDTGASLGSEGKFFEALRIHLIHIGKLRDTCRFKGIDRIMPLDGQLTHNVFR